MTRTPKPRIYGPYGLTGPISERIKQGLADGIFKEAERNIAVAMAENWQQTSWAPASRFAEQAGCDKATVSRFVRRLGYTDHRALQLAARLEVVRDPDTHPPHDANAALQDLKPHDFGRYVEQIEIVASRLSRAKQIVIAGATTGADPWISAIEDLFAAGMMTPVRKAAADDKLAARTGNHLIVVHIDPLSSIGNTGTDNTSHNWRQAAEDGVHAVHLVVGKIAPEQTDAQRVLHLQDDTDRLAGLSMMTDVCVIMIREAIRRDPTKARRAPE
jgi:hypothetical protein